ncbi:hypothetical protein GGI35DRAFT_45624 [Trichoderma velutinum]
MTRKPTPRKRLLGTGLARRIDSLSPLRGSDNLQRSRFASAPLAQSTPFDYTRWAESVEARFAGYCMSGVQQKLQLTADHLRQLHTSTKLTLHWDPRLRSRIFQGCQCNACPVKPYPGIVITKELLATPHWRLYVAQSPSGEFSRARNRLVQRPSPLTEGSHTAITRFFSVLDGFALDNGMVLFFSKTLMDAGA